MDVKDASTMGHLKHDINSAHANNKEVMEMSCKSKATNNKPNVHYTRMSAAQWLTSWNRNEHLIYQLIKRKDSNISLHKKYI